MHSPAIPIMFPLFCAVITLSGLSPHARAAIVDTGISSTKHLSADASLTGSLAGVTIGAPTVNVGPVGANTEIAPAPFSSSQSGPLALTASTANLGLSLGASVNVLDSDLSSSVDESPGTHSTNAKAQITDAVATFGFNTLGALGALELLKVDINPASGTVLEAYADLTSDGSTTTPTMTSNFVSTGAGVVISVLGVNIPITGSLAANTELTVTVNTSASIGLLTAAITGTIKLTPDWREYNVFGSLHEAGAAALLVTADLKIRVPGATVLGVTAPDPLNVDFDADVMINQVMAQMTTADPVPEPSAALLTALVGVTLLSRRRRRAA